MHKISMNKGDFRIRVLDCNEQRDSVLLYYRECPFLQFGQNKDYVGNGLLPVNFNLYFSSSKSLSDITAPSFRFLEKIKETKAVGFKQALKRAGQFDGTIFENMSFDTPSAQTFCVGGLYKSCYYDPSECQKINSDPKNHSMILDNHYASILLHGNGDKESSVRITAFDPTISKTLASYLIDISDVKISQEKTSKFKKGLDDLLSYFNPVILE